MTCSSVRVLESGSWKVRIESDSDSGHFYRGPEDHRTEMVVEIQCNDCGKNLDSVDEAIEHVENGSAE